MYVVNRPASDGSSGYWISTRGLVDPVCSVERCFEFWGWFVVEVAVQPAGVAPVHPTQRCQLDVLDGSPRPGSGGPVVEFALTRLDAQGQPRQRVKLEPVTVLYLRAQVRH
jgi:hypothetical protein